MNADIFLKELQRLINSQPRQPIHENNTENCENSDYVYDSKDLYNCFDVAKSEDSLYLFDSFMAVKSVDCDYAVESELCYESIDPYQCYNSNFIDNCSRLRDSSYCYACWDGHDLFGCSNLRNKSFCIFNRQLTEEEYRREIKKYEKLPPEKVFEILESVESRYPLTQTNEGRNENSSYGNYIYDNKNSYLMYDASKNEDCAYLYDSFNNKTSMDMTYTVFNELSYESVDTSNLFNSDFCVYSSYCHDSAYLLNCFNVKNSLGCVGLKHKQYCILNRQFNQEEYEKISSGILKELQTANPSWNALSL